MSFIQSGLFGYGDPSGISSTFSPKVGAILPPEPPVIPASLRLRPQKDLSIPVPNEPFSYSDVNYVLAINPENGTVTLANLPLPSDGLDG